MKKLIKIMIIMGVIFSGLAIKAFASESGKEYTISQAGDSYILSDGENEEEYQSLNECLGAVNQACLIRMVNVTCSEAITFPKGEFVISGELQSDGIISIPTGTKIDMEYLTLKLGTGGMLE